MKFFRAYKTSIILILSVIIGGIVGGILGTKAKVLEPLGNLFVNLMITMIVPLVFFSISSAIAHMKEKNRFGKIIISIVIAFLFTSCVAALLGIIGVRLYNPVSGFTQDTVSKIMSAAGSETKKVEQVSALQQFVNAVSVSDFSLLFSKSNMLQLIIFSMLFGAGTIMAGEKGKIVSNFLDSGTEVMMKIVKVIMYYAPIGIGCYFASVVGELGGQIFGGYLKTFVLYIALTIIYYFAVLTIYAFIAGKKEGVKVFWKNCIAPSATAIATCSSAACIPINLNAVKNMGIKTDICETVIPMGTNLHKDGSTISGILKIIFLFGLTGRSVTGFGTICGIVIMSLLSGTVMGAVPNGGFIGEMLILNVYSLSPSYLPIIAVISTITDAPATLLNALSNTASTMLVSRLVEGKNWIKAKINRICYSKTLKNKKCVTQAAPFTKKL